MGLTVAPIEIQTFQLVVLVLALFLIVPELRDFVEATNDIGPP